MSMTGHKVCMELKQKITKIFAIKEAGDDEFKHKDLGEEKVAKINRKLTRKLMTTGMRL